jgi:hypothetical protein
MAVGVPLFAEAKGPHKRVDSFYQFVSSVAEVHNL